VSQIFMARQLAMHAEYDIVIAMSVRLSNADIVSNEWTYR